MNSIIYDPRLRRRDEWDGGRGWCRVMGYVGMGVGGVESGGSGADLGRMLDGGDWPRGGPMWRSGPRQIFFFLKHPPTVRSLGSALGVGPILVKRASKNPF